MRATLRVPGGGRRPRGRPRRPAEIPGDPTSPDRRPLDIEKVANRGKRVDVDLLGAAVHGPQRPLTSACSVSASRSSSHERPSLEIPRRSSARPRMHFEPHPLLAATLVGRRPSTDSLESGCSSAAGYPPSTDELLTGSSVRYCLPRIGPFGLPLRLQPLRVMGRSDIVAAGWHRRDHGAGPPLC